MIRSASVLIVAMISACFSATPAAGAGSEARVAGPWYTPQEREALIAYSNASFAEKKAILRGDSRRAVDLARVEWGETRPLRPGVTYRASLFPIAITLRPDGGLWEGNQFIQSDGQAAHGTVLSGGKVAFIGLLHRNMHNAQGSVPSWSRGNINIETAFAQTRSAGATMARIRARLGDLHAGPVTTTRIAGFPGLQFDGRVTGQFHRFVPFSDSDGTRASTDSIRLPRYQRFRVIVLDVRGRAVVIYLQGPEDVTQSASFPVFLRFADRMLASLRFPPAAS